MERDPIIITLNKAALEQLLALDDGDVEMKLHRGIIDAILKKNMKSWMDNGPLKAHTDMMHQELTALHAREVQAQIGLVNRGGGELVLSDKALAAIRQKADEVWKDYLKKAVEEYLAAQFGDGLKETVESVVKYRLRDLVNYELKKRLKQLEDLSEDKKEDK
jgi:hypothetical protein